jgi:hypothetical protein
VARLCDIRSGLADNLNTVQNLTGYAILPSAGVVYPAGIVLGPTTEKSKWRIDYQKGMKGKAEFTLPVVLNMGEGLADFGQETLDPYLDSDGPTSVKLGLEGKLLGGDRTLGGIASMVMVTEVEEYTGVGAIFTVVVWA